MRTSYLVVTKWPCSELNAIGRITSLFTRGTENHIGVFIPNCTESEITRHSDPAVSHPSARGEKDVCFDYIDKKAKFQSFKNPLYYTDSSVVFLHPIIGVDASDLHRSCLEAAAMNPYNFFLYRLNALAWCFPFSFYPSNGLMAPSTCVALSLRVIARAKSNEEAFYDDLAVQDELGITTFGPCTPCQPATLNGHTPRSVLDSLYASNVVGKLVGDFEDAIEASTSKSSKIHSIAIEGARSVHRLTPSSGVRPVLNLILR